METNIVGFYFAEYIIFINSVCTYCQYWIRAFFSGFSKHDFVDSKKFGFVFVLVVVPTIVFFGSVVAMLYFFGIIQRLIAFLAYLLRKTVKLSGVESLIVIADIFLGQSEGPLVIGPYIKSLTKSELACAFIAGLANLSGSTLGMYLAFLSGGDH
ncbi:MAG TPA: nucleoside recognition domain-containing protein, partial [Burkholderiales bacterium]|nr:nucleoside recognition domain-containing protein [Burkholderiales bacterium]